MKIKYQFADGMVSEVEVSEELGAYIIASRREEESQARKQRRHCLSLDQMEYEGECMADDNTPDKFLEELEEEKEYKAFLETLTETQKRRLLLLLEGKSEREIAEIEGTAFNAVNETILQIRKKAKKFF